jgi:MoaA/NifB/PqqE/SkfB family radical SAM enzyme
VLPGDFHPITAYLFIEYKCNLDCWYCWSYNINVKGMTEDVARRSIDWLHDHGCRVLALMGGEPLLRPDFVHKVVYYAAKKGFWVYIATNGRLLKPDLADRLGDAGASAFNFALDSWDTQPSLPKALVPSRKNLEHILHKQYVNGYVVFFNINICRNNTEDVRKLAEYAHDHRVATDYHINETPMLEQDDHFKHLYDNPTYSHQNLSSAWLKRQDSCARGRANGVPDARPENFCGYVRGGLGVRRLALNPLRKRMLARRQMPTTCAEMTTPRCSHLYCGERRPGTQFPDDKSAALRRPERVELSTVRRISAVVRPGCCRIKPFRSRHISLKVERCR